MIAPAFHILRKRSWQSEAIFTELKKQTREHAWQRFADTGEIGAYLVYRSLCKAEEAERRR